MEQTIQSTFVDERSHVTETSYIVPTPRTVARLPNSMAETQFSVKDLLKQEIKYGSFSWSVGDPQGAELYNLSIPAIFNAFSTIHKLQFSTFQFFRFTPKVRVQINSTKFNSGRLMLVWDPLTYMRPVAPLDAPTTDIHTTHLSQCSGYPNSQIDVKDSNSGFILIPFEHIISYFSATTNPVDTQLPLGTLRIMCMNRLTAPDTASNSIGVSIYINCEDIEFHVPTRPHNVAFTSGIRAEAGLVSSIGKTLSTGKGIVNNLSTGNFSGAASGLSDILKNFSLDKPAIPEAKVGNCLATVDPMAHMKGKVDAPRLGATPEGGYLEEGFSQAPPQELMIHEIVQKPMFIGTLAWRTDQAENTVLATIPVTPNYLTRLESGWKYSNSDVVTPPAGQVYESNRIRAYPSYVGYFARLFEYWQGSMDYRFDVVSTMFHTGRLMLAFEPAVLVAPIDPAITDNAFTNAPYQIYDLHESASTSVKVNFVSSVPRKTTAVPTTFFGVVPDDNAVLGYLRVIVVSRLVAPEQVTAEVDVNVWISAGEDFRFSFPRSSNNMMLASDLALIATGPATGIRAEAGLLPTESDISTRTSDPKNYPGLVKGNPMISRKDVFNENVDSVLDLARRYCRVSEFSLLLESSPFGGDFADESIGYAEAVFPVSPGPSVLSGPVDTESKLMDSLSFMKALASMYVFWSGSIRYQFLPFVDRTRDILHTLTYVPNSVVAPPGVATERATASTRLLNSSYPSIVWNSSQDAGMQVEVPFFSKFNQCLVVPKTGTTDLGIDAFFSGQLVYRVMQPIESTSLPTRRMYVVVNSSIGDDFKFRFLVAPPVVMLNPE